MVIKNPPGLVPLKVSIREDILLSVSYTGISLSLSRYSDSPLEILLIVSDIALSSSI